MKTNEFDPTTHTMYEWTEHGPSAMTALIDQREQYRQAGKTVITTNGCFDLLHKGHLQFLTDARALGEILTVGINSDESVAALKGPNRPIQPVADRALMLKALRVVDHVVIFTEPLPNRWLDAIAPDIHCKAADYAAHELPEAQVVEKHGGIVTILALTDGYSTTNLITRINAADRADRTS